MHRPRYYRAVLVFETLRENPWRLATLVLALILLGFVAFFLVARAGDDSSPAAASTTTTLPAVLATTAPESEASDDTADDGAGEPTSAGAGGLIAVKVDNAPEARPLVGLNASPLVVEHLVEGGITRFTAVYPGPDGPQVGPVRSLRPVDVDLLPQLAPVLVSSGGRPWILGEVEATGVANFGPELITFFLPGTNPDPHNTYVVVNWLYEFVQGDFEPATGLPTGELPDPAGTASTIELPFGDIVFQWEEAFGYGRSQEGSSFQVADEINGPTSQLTHDTLVILYAAQRDAGYTDSNDVPVMTWDVIGSGSMLVFDNGEVYEGRWIRQALADQFVFVSGDGLTFGLPEGKVYMAVVDRDLTVEYR